MKVVGIDVGPGKGAHICEDGSQLRKMKPADLDIYLKGLPNDVLVAWDAPLTGPPDPEVWTGGRDLTMREIERFFGRSGSCPAPNGISVRPYCGCPHWTISRRLLGLPRVGPYDVAGKLPFALASDDRNRPSKGRYVVEVHPAVALWRWCSGDYPGPWKYKKDKKCLKKLRELMSRRAGKLLSDICDDDELDAWTGWYLARCWLDRNGVMLLGNAKTGSFLLPDQSKLREKFEQFVFS